MSDTIVLHNDGEGADVTMAAIESRKIVTAIGQDLELKGGEAPRLWFAQEAVVQPVYIVGSDSSVSISPKRTTVQIPNVTLAANESTVSGIINNPTRLCGFCVTARCTAITGGTVDVNVQYSWDGVNFFNNLDGITFTMVENWIAYTSSGSAALPPYLRVHVLRDATAGDITLEDIYLTVVT